MRISDWSSDVCSSDLRDAARRPRPRWRGRRHLGLHASRLCRQSKEFFGGCGMTVYFIGAGPGAPALITLRGRDLIARAPVVRYAGSLVPPEVVAYSPAGPRVIATTPLNIGRAAC